MKLSKRQKAILTTAFEGRPGMWVWYRNAWSGGVRVTDDERQVFLEFRVFEFRKAVAGRPATEPRRPYWPTLKRLLSAQFSGRDQAGQE